MAGISKIVFGKGYNGVGSHLKSVGGNHTKSYIKWKGMLERCYSEKCQKKQPTYIGCSVAEEWLDFQNFAQWFEEKHKGNWFLDKDILVKGNKVYSPETCCFVPNEINVCFTKNNKTRGILPLGVSKRGDSNKFKSQIKKGGRVVHLGDFFTLEEAFQAYKTAKEEYIKELADKYYYELDNKVYTAMYNYQVEITD